MSITDRIHAARERRVSYLIGELCRDDVQAEPALAAAFEHELAQLERRVVDAEDLACELGIDTMWVYQRAAALGGWRVGCDEAALRFDLTFARAAYGALAT